MFQLLEIVGVSYDGYSDAIKNALEELNKSGEKVHWFEVMEQRGAMRERGVQFQVKLKVAIAVESDEEKSLYLCPSCGKAAERSEELCAVTGKGL
jgi:dodecin